MSEKNEHIDKLFSDKLKQAEVSPPPGLWNDIEASLDLQIVKRRLIPIWMRYTAAAAVVVLFVISGILYLDTTPEIEPTEQSIIKVDSVTEQPEVKEIKQEETESTIIEEIEEPIKETYIAKVEGILTEQKPQKESRIQNIARSIAGLYDVSVIKLNRIIFDLPVEEKSASQKYREYLAQQERIFRDDKPKKENRFALAMGGSPSLESRSISTGGQDMLYSPNTEGFYDVSNRDVPIFGEESRLNSFTWGVDVYLSIDDKWSFKSGVYYLNQGRNISNYSALFNTLSYNNSMNVNSSSGNIRVDNSMFLVENSVLNEDVELTDATSAANYNSDLIQRFSYLEIPFNFNYNLVDQKMKISLSAGLNTAILIGNSVFLKGFENQKVGETEDLNNVLYKGVLGFNIHYPIIDKLYLNISPSYKYQFNDVNKINARNERVTYFDFKTGLSYWF